MIVNVAPVSVQFGVCKGSRVGTETASTMRSPAVTATGLEKDAGVVLAMPAASVVPPRATLQVAVGHRSPPAWSAVTDPDTLTVPDTGDVQATTAGLEVVGWSTACPMPPLIATNGDPAESRHPMRLPLMLVSNVSSRL